MGLERGSPTRSHGSSAHLCDTAPVVATGLTHVASTGVWTDAHRRRSARPATSTCSYTSARAVLGGPGTMIPRGAHRWAPGGLPVDQGRGLYVYAQGLVGRRFTHPAALPPGTHPPGAIPRRPRSSHRSGTPRSARSGTGRRWRSTRRGGSGCRRSRKRSGSRAAGPGSR